VDIEKLVKECMRDTTNTRVAVKRGGQLCADLSDAIKARVRAAGVNSPQLHARNVREVALALLTATAQQHWGFLMRGEERNVALREGSASSVVYAIERKLKPFRELAPAERERAEQAAEAAIAASLKGERGTFARGKSAPGSGLHMRFATLCEQFGLIDVDAKTALKRAKDELEGG
jgi:hypothetical protein